MGTCVKEMFAMQGKESNINPTVNLSLEECDSVLGCFILTTNLINNNGVNSSLQQNKMIFKNALC